MTTSPTSRAKARITAALPYNRHFRRNNAASATKPPMITGVGVEAKKSRPARYTQVDSNSIAVRQVQSQHLNPRPEYVVRRQTDPPFVALQFKLYGAQLRPDQRL